MDKYDERIRKQVQIKKISKPRHKEWFNGRCEGSKDGKRKAWNPWRRHKRHNHWLVYTQKRSGNGTENYEKDIVDKCKDQPKLLYRYINGKLKNTEK